MKTVVYTSRFRHAYKKRVAQDGRLKKEYLDSITTFLSGDKASVSDHPLKGPLQGQRAFSVNKDVRIVYSERVDSFLFKDVGTHKQVYIKS